MQINKLNIKQKLAVFSGHAGVNFISKKSPGGYSDSRRQGIVPEIEIPEVIWLRPYHSGSKRRCR